MNLPSSVNRNRHRAARVNSRTSTGAFSEKRSWRSSRMPPASTSNHFLTNVLTVDVDQALDRLDTPLVELLDLPVEPNDGRRSPRET